MFEFYYYSIFLISVILIIFLLSKLRQKATNELEKVLYIENKPELYLKLLKNPRLKILYSKSTLAQFQLNAYLLSGDDHQIENTIQMLDTMIMTKGQNLEYNQKKLSYYCSLGKRDKAEDTLNKIESMLSKVKGEKAQSLLKESKLIFDIYIRHDTKLIEELEQTQVNQQGAARGLTLFRLAKLSYFDRENNKARAYLAQAKELLRSTAWSDIVESALKDLSILNYK